MVCHTDVATDRCASSTEIRKGEVHAPNDTTWASNTVASANTRTYRLARKRNRIVKRGGSGWAAAEARSRSVAVGPARLTRRCRARAGLVACDERHYRD